MEEAIMENNPQACALLRPKADAANMPSSGEKKHGVDNHVHLQVMELTRLRIERDRAARHAHCAILKQRLAVQPVNSAQQTLSYF
jgi:hypothetical protein